MSQPGPDRQLPHYPHPPLASRLPQRPLPGARPQAPPPPPKPPSNGFGVAALVLAVIGLVFEFVPLSGFVSFISGAVGVGFGVLGVLRDGRGLANLWLCGLGAALSLTALVLGIWSMAATAQPTTAPADDTGSAGRR